MIHVKDVFAVLAEGRRPPPLIDLIRQPLYVPQSMGVLDLLAGMRAQRTHLAIVIDEYSGTEGLVTIEEDRKSVVSGKSVSVRVDLGGRRIIKKKKSRKQTKERRTS